MAAVLLGGALAHVSPLRAPALHGWARLPPPALARRARPAGATLVTPNTNVTAVDDAAAVAAPELTSWRARPAGLLWRFSRPHTMIGSALCIPSLTLYAVPAGAPLLTPALCALVAYAMVPALLVNIYIVGLNQLCDIEIDKVRDFVRPARHRHRRPRRRLRAQVNKPSLPLASGELSPRSGALIIGASLLLGLGLGWAYPPLTSRYLRLVLCGSAALGTAYSLPPLRLKRSPLAASVCIMAVRAAAALFVVDGFSAGAAAAAVPWCHAPSPRGRYAAR